MIWYTRKKKRGVKKDDVVFLREVFPTCFLHAGFKSLQFRAVGVISRAKFLFRTWNVVTVNLTGRGQRKVKVY